MMQIIEGFRTSLQNPGIMTRCERKSETRQCVYKKVRKTTSIIVPLPFFILALRRYENVRINLKKNYLTRIIYAADERENIPTFYN